MNWTLLIDADVLAYRITSACEKPVHWGEDDWSLHCNMREVRDEIDSSLARMTTELKDLGFPIGTIRLFLSDNTHNFRKDILPTYKGNRDDKRKPVCFTEARKYLASVHLAEIWDNIEADDAIGITATSPELRGKCIIASIDKDFATIPETWTWNPWDQSFSPPKFTDELEAETAFLTQVLMGDSVDNYKGIKGFGIVKSTKWLEKHGVSWTAVVAAYHANGMTEEDALVNARMAHILQWGDYNRETGVVDLWGEVS